MGEEPEEEVGNLSHSYRICDGHTYLLYCRVLGDRD